MSFKLHTTAARKSPAHCPANTAFAPLPTFAMSQAGSLLTVYELAQQKAREQLQQRVIVNNKQRANAYRWN
jgi:hypothetical protein